MADITNFQLDEDGDPVAELLLPTGETVELTWMSDDDDEVLPGEVELRALADTVLDGMSAEHFEATAETVVEELVDAAFQQLDEEPEEKDFRALAGDLILDGVTVFTDETVALSYIAPNVYPDMGIYVQLDSDFTVADIFAE